MNHYPKWLFTGYAHPDLQNHRCVTCQEIPVEPRQHSPCGHIFCRNCATGGIQRREETESTSFFELQARSTQIDLSGEMIVCQGCIEESNIILLLNKFHEDKGRQRDIERLHIRCPCPMRWEGPLLEYLQNHRTICRH